jgi:hypothetical protein
LENAGEPSVQKKPSVFTGLTAPLGPCGLFFPKRELVLERSIDLKLTQRFPLCEVDRVCSRRYIEWTFFPTLKTLRFDCMFRPLGVGNRGGTSGLEISNEDLAALEEAEDEDDGEAQLCKLRLSIEQLEQALNIVFWRGRAGLASKLKVHADGPHQQNKLLIRLGSVSSLDIWHG